jgi:hypothetical protein
MRMPPYGLCGYRRNFMAGAEITNLELQITNWIRWECSRSVERNVSPYRALF